MDARLYLLEIFVDEITFFESSGQESLMGDNALRVVAQIENFYYLEVRTGTMLLTPITSDAETEDLRYQLKIGKSALFPSKASALIVALNTPLHVDVITNGKSVATTLVPWTSVFQNVINTSQKLNEHLPPAKMHGTHKLLGYDGSVYGTITLMVTLTAFGNNIRTVFRVVENPDSNTYDYQMFYRNLSAIFHCGDKKNTTTSSLPIFNIGSLEMRHTDHAQGANSASWYPLYKSTVSPKVSSTPGPAAPPAPANPQPSRCASHSFLDGGISAYSVSIFDRPDEHKFMNLGRTDSGGFLDCDDCEMGGHDLTVEQIEQQLCQSRNCPAAKKFKEFGIGPLATHSGLGGTYRNTTCSCKTTEPYAMSQTYGTMQCYGPYGMLQKPKDPLRLNGGGANLYMENIKSPMVECQGLLQEVDNIVSNFRKALGPCGQALCPYSQNQIEERCKIDCGKLKTSHPGGGEVAAGCGSPKCVYTKYRDGLMEQDALIERQFLPPSVANEKCRQSCPFLQNPPLPPIHWDCPVPLPDGLCRNPKCPHLPPDLKRICDLLNRNDPNPLCENPECPYAAENDSEIEGLCDNPDCPFAAERSELCENPICPYVSAENAIDVHCSNTNCPLAKILESCSSPLCPFVKFLMMFLGAATAPTATCPGGGDVQDTTSAEVKMEQQGKKSVVGAATCGNYVRKKYRASIKDDEIVQGVEYPIEYYSDTRVALGDTRPCRPDSCRAMDGYLECAECPGGGACQCECCQVVQGPRFSEQSGRPSASSSSQQRKSDNSETVQDQSLDQSGNNSLPYGEVLRLEKPARLSEDRNRKSDSANNEDDEEGEAPRPRMRQRERHGKFIYAMGNSYPGVHVGHRECVVPNFNVPADMGWLWNIHTPCMQLRPRRGWRPGAIGRLIAGRIRRHRLAQGLSVFEPPKFGGKKRKKGAGGYGEEEEEPEVNVRPRPTLQIQKKDGAYLITMNPLKDPKSLVPNEDPYIDCTPIQFKIVKQKKTDDETNEFECCPIGDGANGDSKEICCYKPPPPPHSESSESELDIEFTPPAGIIHPERFKKIRNVVHCATQCEGSASASTLGGKKKKKGGKGGKKKKKK